MDTRKAPLPVPTRGRTDSFTRPKKERSSWMKSANCRWRFRSNCSGYYKNAKCDGLVRKRETAVDVRVVAATNRDIEQEVADGSFRQDLYYRLNVIHLHIPPLRERAEDVALLAQHFLDRHAALHKKQLRFAPDALRALSSYDFPGNVRELENLIERAVTLALGSDVTADDLRPRVLSDQALKTEGIDLEIPEDGLDLDETLARIERRLLTQALERSGGVQKAAARLLKTTFRSLRYRLAKYGLRDD